MLSKIRYNFVSPFKRVKHVKMFEAIELIALREFKNAVQFGNTSEKVNCKQVNLFLLTAPDPHIGDSPKYYLSNGNQLNDEQNNVQFGITLQKS